MRHGFPFIRRNGLTLRARKGFTLIEVLTTIVIFGVLVSITSYVYGISLARSRDTQRLSDLNNIKNSLEQYYLEHRAYPYNTAYRAANIPRPWVAKFELERYVLESRNCDSAVGDPGKAGLYLAPTYMTTIPEDPKYPIISDLTGDCQLGQSVGRAPGYGQYIYASLATDENDRIGQYYLMARLERPTHVSEQFPQIANNFDLTLNRINSWGNTYCSEATGDPNGQACSHNYYLKNSNND